MSNEVYCDSNTGCCTFRATDNAVKYRVIQRTVQYFAR